MGNMLISNNKYCNDPISINSDFEHIAKQPTYSISNKINVETANKIMHIKYCIQMALYDYQTILRNTISDNNYTLNIISIYGFEGFKCKFCNLSVSNAHYLNNTHIIIILSHKANHFLQCVFFNQKTNLQHIHLIDKIFNLLHN